MSGIYEAGPVAPEPRCRNCGTLARPTDRFCGSCGRSLADPATGPAGPSFCRSCGAPLAPGQRFCINCGTAVAQADLPGAALSNYPLRYDVEYPEKLSRWLIFVKWLLAIPQFLVVYAFGYATAAITVVAFFAILFTGRYPRGLFNLVVGFNRWSANVTAYTYLFRDEYPPFSMDPGQYPVLYEVDYPERLSRWWIWVKWFLVIPHQIVISLLSLVGFFLAFLSFFSILFTGRYPRGFFNFNVGLQRWQLRVTAYSSLLRDEFPPYSRRADAGPGSRRAMVLSAVFAVLGLMLIIAAIVAFVLAFEAETQTVEVQYQQALAGRATAPVDVAGTIVTLEGAYDPYEDPVLAEPEGGERYVAFELEIANENALFTFVEEEAYEMEDISGDGHEPADVYWTPAHVTSPLVQDEEVRVTVVFELDEADDPASLTYTPSGYIAFGPLGEKVRFEFH